MSVLLRPATADDAYAIAAVQTASWRTTYRGMIDDAYLDALSPEHRARGWEHWFASENLERRSLLVAAGSNAGVVGFAAAGPERDCDINNAGELYAIYLLAEHQRHGIGALLFTASARALHAAGMNTMLLWVLAANPSRAFYERMGGVTTRQQETVIGDRTYPEAGYTWQLPLPDIVAI